MGEIRSNVELENTVDRGVFDRGHGEERAIRGATVDGVVDTGAVTLVLPQNVVERLGLEQQGTAFVTCADERRDERPLAGPVTVRIGNRAMVTHCVVGPPLSEPLIGQVVLETLDLTRLHEPNADAAVPGLPTPQAEGDRDDRAASINAITGTHRPHTSAP